MTGAMASITPTILASKSSIGVVPSTRLGNVAWNDDGQCLVLSKKEVVIMTPHLVSSLPLPPSLVDPNMVIESAMSVINRGKKGYGAVREDPDKAQPPEASTSYKPQVRRPKGGPVKWWTSAVELAQATKKDTRYQWAEVGRDADWMLRDEDVAPRQAVWSPSGLTDLGGCMLAVLNTTGQVSIYAPRGDPFRTQWDEICDLSCSTKSLFRPRIPASQKVTNAQMREMQTTYLAWSPSLQLESAIGLNSSLLAMADRANQIGFWSYGPDKRFHRVAILSIGNIWATNLAWSDWVSVGNNTCEARLAFSTSDGTVGIIPVRQAIGSTPDGKKYLETFGGQLRIIDQGDRRKIACLKWLAGVLIWTKPGSIHFWNESQNDVRAVRLERVGNWAGCNALGPCVGINSLSPTSIAIVLSTSTIHIIQNITTSPVLAPISESLVATLAARQAFLDHVVGDYASFNKFTLKAAELELLTAYTSGWTGLGLPGLATVNWEAINFHNLDTANEGKRLTAFTVFDMTDSLPGVQATVLESLRHLIDNPTNPIIVCPSRQLLPHVLRLIAIPPDQVAVSELLDLCDPTNVPPVISQTETSGLSYALFGLPALNILRVKYALASWCSRTYSGSQGDFDARSNTLLQAITSTLLVILIQQVSMKVRAITPASLDHRMIRALIASHRRLNMPPDGPDIQRLVAAYPLESEAMVELCPACRQSVDEGDLIGICKCPKGHEWTRCSITGLLITTPTYRTCTTCPAIALLPSRIERPPIPVSESGQERDHERFAKPVRPGEEVIQDVLESCHSCIICGGRWIRAV